MRAGSPVGLIDALYGVGELTAITILAETRRPLQVPDSRDVVHYADWIGRIRACLGTISPTPVTSLSNNPTSAAPGVSLPSAAARVALDAVASRPERSRPRESRPRLLPTTAARIGGNRACLAVSRQLLKRSYPHSARDRRAGAHARVTQLAPAKALTQPTRRGRLSALRCRHAAIGSVVWEP
jgi:hypothetical protein